MNHDAHTTPLFAAAIVLTLASSALAQLHGEIAPVERSRELGITEGSIVDVFVAGLEYGHNAEAWGKHEAVCFEVTLTLGEEDPRSLTGVFEVNGPRFVIHSPCAALLGHDGTSSWSTPKAETLGTAAVHVRALPHLLVLPFHMRDAKMLIASSPMREVGDRRFYAASVLFPDSDDWLIPLADPRTNLLHILAYFVKLTEDDNPRFSQAYAAVAAGHERTDEVTFIRQWHLWRWSRLHGLVGEEPIGSVSISGVRFIELDEDAFAAPKQPEP